MPRSKGKKDYVRQKRKTRKNLLAFLSSRVGKQRVGDGWRRGYGVFPEDVAQIRNKKSRANRRRKK